MIVDLILDFLQAIVEGVLGLIPSVSFLADWTGAFADAAVQLGEWAAPMGAWVPVTFMAACVGAVIAFRLAMMALGFALRVYALVRGGGD